MDTIPSEEMQYLRRIVRSRLEQELENYTVATTDLRHEECWGRIAALDQCKGFTTYGRLRQELRWAQEKMERNADDPCKGMFFTGYRDALADISLRLERRRRTAMSSPSLSE